MKESYERLITQFTVSQIVLNVDNHVLHSINEKRRLYRPHVSVTAVEVVV